MCQSKVTCLPADCCFSELIMCQSKVTCLPADCCFSELALWKSICFGLVQSGPHHHLIMTKLVSCHDIADKLVLKAKKNILVVSWFDSILWIHRFLVWFRYTMIQFISLDTNISVGVQIYHDSIHFPGYKNFCWGTDIPWFNSFPCIPRFLLGFRYTICLKKLTNHSPTNGKI